MDDQKKPLNFQEGFLSSGMVDWTLDTRMAAASWFFLVTEINKGAMSILVGLRPKKNSEEQLIAAALYGRAVQSFQGAIILAERGMLADANTLTRSVVETAIFICGIACVEGFLSRMASSNKAHYFGMAKALVGQLEQGDEAARKDAEEVRLLLQSIEEGKFKISDIKLRNLASEVGMDPLYEFMYREISGNSAHPSLSSAERHIERDSNGNVEGLCFKPVRIGMKKTISLAITALLGATHAIGQAFESANVQKCVENWNDQHSQLAENLED